MFETALKEHYRFPSVKGNVTTEDLWDMPLKAVNNYCLNSVAKTLSAAMKESETEDFVSKVTTSNSLLEAKMDIVKHIIAVKLEDKERAKNAKATKERREYLLSLKAGKEQEQDLKMSVKDIDKELAALDN